MLMAVLAARLNLTRPSELARSLAVDRTPLVSEKVSDAPSIVACTETIAVVVLTWIDNALLQTCAALSLACTVKFAVWAVVGVPEIMPPALLMVSPAGSVPEITDHV
jgi:hypothetical protein